MRAQELANDLAHQLELVEAERDEAVRERDEAQAVVDAVGEVRDFLVGEMASGILPPDAFGMAEVVVDALNKVDGL